MLSVGVIKMNWTLSLSTQSLRSCGSKGYVNIILQWSVEVQLVGVKLRESEEAICGLNLKRQTRIHCSRQRTGTTARDRIWDAGDEMMERVLGTSSCLRYN